MSEPSSSQFIADFHLHSRFANATSKHLKLPIQEQWAKAKGIHVLGSGDCQHPIWLNELKEGLIQQDNGLFKIKPQNLDIPDDIAAPIALGARDMNIILTTEISTIYKKKDKVRKNHNICIFPSFAAVDRFQKRLDSIGNIKADGRPILGMSAKALLEILLESDPDAYMIPAHVWTPWFSTLGSKSGYDSVEDCFEDLTGEIFAIETGLSADPDMFRRCGFLDKFTLVSNSDAHSPKKLGREANLFSCEMDYAAIKNALKTKTGFEGTIEFFPEEGKYHYDGHRNCNICWDPNTTKKHSGICTVCQKPVVKGVMYRLNELADREHPIYAKNDPGFKTITPLPEILSEILNLSTTAKKLNKKYNDIITNFGTEFDILLNLPTNTLRQAGEAQLATCIQNLRDKKAVVQPGYDGVFGKISLLGAQREP